METHSLIYIRTFCLNFLMGLGVCQEINQVKVLLSSGAIWDSKSSGSVVNLHLLSIFYGLLDYGQMKRVCVCVCVCVKYVCV